ncbi:MAG: VanZ family protein [Patescibacteria group bacterium]|nr:VanZ family protein [Patescibacteria group bacterium]
MKKTVLLLSLWLPVVLWCLLIFYLSSIPNLKAAENPLWDEIIRSFIHGLFYAILYFLLFRAFNFTRKLKNFYLPLMLSFLYGLSDEIHQFFVPTRTFQFKDLLVDFIGIIAGGFTLWKLLPKTQGKLRDWAKRLALI